MKMNLQKKVLGIILTASLAVSMSACGSSNEQQLATADNTANQTADSAETLATDASADSATATISDNVISEAEASLTMMSYYDGEDDPLNNYAYAKVKEAFPNVTIEFESEPQDGGQTIKTRAATGDLPDIMLADSGTISILAESGSILQLDDYMKELNYEDKLVQGAIQTCLTSPDGHIYEFPIGGVSPILWYYNKAIFKQYNVEVPTNYDELLAVVKTFRENDVTPLATFAKEPWNVGAIFDSFAVKEDPTGCYGLSEGKAKASDSTYSNAIGKLTNLINAGMFQEGCTNCDFDTASALFTEGQSAMFINGSWYIVDANDALGDDLGVFEFYPTADAGKEETNKYAVTGGGDTCGLTITQNAKDPDLCAQVASVYAYNREIAEYKINNSVTVPVKTEGIETDTSLCPASEQLLEMIPNLTYESKFLHTLPNTEFATSFTEEMQKLLVGESKEDFIKNVDTSIENSTK